MKCQCNLPSMDHPKGRCHHEASLTVKRGDRTIAICGDCKLSKDIVIPPLVPKEN